MRKAGDVVFTDVDSRTLEGIVEFSNRYVRTNIVCVCACVYVRMYVCMCVHVRCVYVCVCTHERHPSRFYYFF